MIRRAAWFAAAFALAAALYVYLWQDRCVLWVLAGAAVLALGVFFLRLRCSRAVCVVCLGLCAGVLWCFFYGWLFLPDLERLAETEQPVTLTVTDVPWETDYGMSVEVRLEDQSRSCGAVLYADFTELQPGDHVSCTARIRRTGGNLLAGESLSLRAGGIQLVLYAKSPLHVTAGSMPWHIRVRQWFQGRIHSLYHGQAAGLVRALLTGDREELPYAVRNDMAVAGVSHAIAVSGMHVSMLLALVALLCGRRPLATALLGLPLALAFAVVTGGSPSVVRSAVMEGFLLGASILHREYDLPTALGMAALALLLQNPWVIANVSFQLSFAAVVGIYLLAARLYQRLLGKAKKPGRLRRAVAMGLAATLSATALTLPLSAVYFGMLSLVAPLTNLLVLWAVTAVFTLGLLSCLLGPLGPVLAWAVTRLCRYILWVCGVLASFPYAAAYAGSPLLLWGFCAYGAAIVLLLWRRARPILPACALAALLLVCLIWSRWQWISCPMSFTALDVGQGQCLILEAQGFTAMVDCGGDGREKAGETAARFLHRAGQTHLDALILTHYDLDHVGGVCQLLHRVQVDRLLLPETEGKQEIKAAIEAAALEAGTRILEITEKTDLRFSAGEIQIIPPVSGENSNEGGICVLATAAEYDILITGDLSMYGEAALLSAWNLPQVDLLVAGHHGSADSTSLALLGRVRPEAAVISVGADNAYGHPSPKTLERLTLAGAKIYRTDLQGTISIRE